MNAPERLTGTIPRERARDTPAIDLFRAMAAGQLPAPPIGQTMNFNLVEVEPGRVVFAGTPDRRYLNPIGTVHGGWVATLLDSCMTCAVHATLPAGQACTTVEMKVNFVRPLSEAIGEVRAEGRVIHAGKTISTAEGKLTDAKGTLLAHGSTTVMTFAI
ncbi:PaaI family thioesterase [Desertibaculum subflavum]|uniref:PaaI family thioesterase n=1 Tax=Desertibaculum subflavum TaxID=2268458 RepID=UPI0034D1AEBF